MTDNFITLTDSKGYVVGWFVNDNLIMREPTKEERDSVKAYVKSISQNTGISFYDFVKGA